MKYSIKGSGLFFCLVAPFAGAWIEIPLVVYTSPAFAVAPFAGAWIEISLDRLSQGFGSMSLPSRERGLKLGNNGNPNGATVSLPSRERGLKLLFPLESSAPAPVAPFAGAWIEMIFIYILLSRTNSRSLRGSVD